MFHRIIDALVEGPLADRSGHNRGLSLIPVVFVFVVVFHCVACPSSPEEFQFEGESLLFPEMSQDGVIFEAPEERIESYREKLRKAGLELVEIENAATAT